MVNRRKAKVSRLTRKFSQAVAVNDAQPCLVAGMSQHSVSKEFSQIENGLYGRNALPVEIDNNSWTTVLG